MSTSVEQIKERLNIVDVVSQYVKLTKAGKNYRGLSPFKKEKTPSFYVSPDRGMYYCFSTNKGGDAFTFVQEMEGLDFRGALKVLAERAGVELRAEPKGARDEREHMYLALEEATQFFEKNLAHHKDAREYLVTRGLKEKTMRAFRLGFAADDWNTLHDHLKKKGYSDRELEKVGLIKRGERGRYYDRFRSRIMFPIFDSAGRTVAYSGRIFGEAAKDKENAKYLNSPETPLFDKSRVLYGYDKARSVIRKYNFSIIVEGQMDLVMSHQAGYVNTVAVSGTGLTSHHLEALARVSPNVVMAFDADAAGIASASKAATLALSKSMEVKVAALPKGNDPADILKENPDAWRAAIRDAKHIVLFSLDVIDAEAKDDRVKIKRVYEETLPFVATLQNKMDQAYFVSRISERLRIQEDPIWEEVKKRISQNNAGENAQERPSEPKRKNIRTRKDYLERSLVGLLWFAQEVNEGSLRDVVLTEYARITGGMLEQKTKTYDHEKTALLFEAEITFGDNRKEKVEEVLHEFEHEWLTQEIETLSRALKETERAGHEDESERLLREVREKSVRKNNLGRKP